MLTLIRTILVWPSIGPFLLVVGGISQVALAQERIAPDRVEQIAAPVSQTWADMTARDSMIGPAREIALEAVPRSIPRVSPVDSAPGALAPSAASLAADWRAPQTLTASFLAVSLDLQGSDFGSGSIPPDTMGAVGPNHFLEIINSSVAVYNKTTGAQISHVSLSSFFSTNINGTFDPRVIYDRSIGRFIACTLELGVVSGQDNDVILAISRTSDPTGTWDQYRIPAGIITDTFVAGETYFTDYDTLGTDTNGIYVGNRIFGSISTGFAQIIAVEKSKLLGTPGTYTPANAFIFNNVTGEFSTPQPAHNFDLVGLTEPVFFAGQSSAFFGQSHFRTLTWSGTAGSRTPALSASIFVSTLNYRFPFDAPAQGSTTNVDTGDIRMLMAVIRNGRLWSARGVGLDSVGGATGTIDRNGVHWMEFNISSGTPVLVQDGMILDSGATPIHYYFPSVMVNGQGHAVVGFSGSNASQFVASYFTGRLAGDPAGAMGAIELIKAGEAAYTSLDSIGRNRWGDYSYTSLDPDDDMTFRTIQEYADTPTLFSSSWGTVVAKLLSPPPTVNNPAASGSTGASGVAVNLTSTGAFDSSDAMVPNGLSVTFSGTGITVNSTTFNGPTSVDVTIDISVSAPAGARDITLTNPDGQAATVVGGFTVVSSTFTDDPLMPGTTPIKAVHFTELRGRIDVQRARFSLLDYMYTNTIAASGTIEAVDLLEMYTAVNAALAAASESSIAVPSITVGVTTVDASHITSLRAAVLTLEAL